MIIRDGRKHKVEMMEAFLYTVMVLFAVTTSRTQETQTTGEDWSPYFGEPMANVTVPLGREAIFTCVVRNLGHFKVGWLRAEDQTLLGIHNFVVTHNTRVSVSQDPERGIWRLHIRQLRNSDRGCYMCQINSATMLKQIGCLDVQVPPDIVDAESSTDVTVSEGDNVTLSCRATGRPDPRIVWKREDSAQITAFSAKTGFTPVDNWNGEVLQIVNVDYKQMGAYLCIATNDIPPAVSKRIVLIVNFAPVVQSPPETSIGAALGSTISFSCIFHGHPNEKTSWHREIGRIEEYGGDYTVSEKRNSYEVTLGLTIRNLRPIDIGRYYCCLANEKGMARGTIYLYEIKPETSTTERTTTPLKTRKPTTRAPTTITIPTQMVLVTPTFLGDTNEISELAVEAERRSGSSGSQCTSCVATILLTFVCLFVR